MNPTGPINLLDYLIRIFDAAFLTLCAAVMFGLIVFIGEGLIELTYEMLKTRDFRGIKFGTSPLDSIIPRSLKDDTRPFRPFIRSENDDLIQF